ncbi:MAG TPA: SLC13 family permease [Candidatus Thermoplasmatota archaeon]|nr:SLC13 family permease [Candidatus Thermoplasmatota archaeon]
MPLLILVATMVLLSIGRLPRLGGRKHRAWIALAGGAAMIATGSLSLQGARDAVNLDILALLFGMLALAASLELCGFFDWLSRKVVERSRSQVQLLGGTMLASAVLSALILNDAVVLLFTPVLVKAARVLGIDPMPYLAGEAIAANIGSVATPVGNPQNAYIAIASGIAFTDYVAALLPVAVVALALGFAITALVFRRSLAAPLGARATPLEANITHPALLRVALAILAAVFVGFLLAGPLRVSIAHVALAGGVVVLAATLLLAPRRAPEMVGFMDLSILVFFVGLFWLIAGFQQAGLNDELAAVFLGGAAPSLLSLTAWSAALSQLVSNVPAVILIAPTVHAAGSSDLWLALAASSTLAGNATLVGAAANVIVAERARANGADFSVRRFMLAGLPVSLATLAAMLALLAL